MGRLWYVEFMSKLWLRFKKYVYLIRYLALSLTIFRTILWHILVRRKCSYYLILFIKKKKGFQNSKQCKQKFLYRISLVIEIKFRKSDSYNWSRCIYIYIRSISLYILYTCQNTIIVYFRLFFPGTRWNRYYIYII